MIVSGEDTYSWFVGKWMELVMKFTLPIQELNAELHA